MNVLDLIVLIPIVCGAIGGFRKGFIIGVISLLALIIGVFGGFYFLDWGVTILVNEFGFSGKMLPILAFIVIFLTIIIAVNFIGKLLKKIIHMILLGGVDRIAGALVGAFMWTFLVSSFIWVASIFKFSFSDEWVQNSLLYDYIRPIAPMIASMLDGVIPAVSDIFDGLSELIDTAIE